MGRDDRFSKVILARVSYRETVGVGRAWRVSTCGHYQSRESFGFNEVLDIGTLTQLDKKNGTHDLNYVVYQLHLE